MLSSIAAFESSISGRNRYPCWYPTAEGVPSRWTKIQPSFVGLRNPPAKLSLCFAGELPENATAKRAHNNKGLRRIISRLEHKFAARPGPHRIIVGEVQLANEGVDRERELNSLSTVTMIVVLAIVTMTFGAMIAVFLVRSFGNQFWGHLRIPALLWVTTAILVASSFTLQTARERLGHGDQPGFFRWMRWTTLLGSVFLLGQIGAWFEVLRSGLVLQNNPHSWFIFLFSGLHGLHIVVGLGGLAYLLWRTRMFPSGPKYRMTTRVIARGVSLFWHYLDFLWVLMFVLLVFWRP